MALSCRAARRRPARRARRGPGPAVVDRRRSGVAAVGVSPAERGFASGALDEHPAMTLGILDANEPPTRAVLGTTEHPASVPLEVLDHAVEVVDGRPHAIDDPRHRVHARDQRYPLLEMVRVDVP